MPTFILTCLAYSLAICLGLYLVARCAKAPVRLAGL